MFPWYQYARVVAYSSSHNHSWIIHWYSWMSIVWLSVSKAADMSSKVNILWHGWFGVHRGDWMILLQCLCKLNSGYKHLNQLTIIVWYIWTNFLSLLTLKSIQEYNWQIFNKAVKITQYRFWKLSRTAMLMLWIRIY